MAYNAQMSGGHLLIVISQNNQLTLAESNSNEKLADRINIPVIIIGNNDSNIIKNHINSNGDVHLAVTFSQPLIKIDGDTTKKVKLMLFLRSDKPHSLLFFKEFQSYFNQLIDYIEFEPFYKYYTCEDCQVSYDITEQTSGSCLKSNEFCSLGTHSKSK